MVDEVVLITGFPSLGARKLLELVLDTEPSTQIIVVVLDKWVPRAAAVVEQLGPELSSRVEVLAGDAAAVDLGLSGREYRELAAKVTCVHHMAHVSYVGVDEKDAEYTNVGGAIEMVELGRAAEQLRCIVHHSTAHVSGDRTGLIYEADLETGQGFYSVVQATRYEAERVLRRAMPEVPIAVVRPTMIVGDSVTGEFERIEGANLLAMLVLGLHVHVPLPAPGQGPLDVVPLDFVTRASRAIGLHGAAAGRTFHITSSESLTAETVLDMIARAGGRRIPNQSSLAAQLASVIMRTPGISRLVHEPRALLRQLATPATYDTRNARQVIDAAGIECPPLAGYVDNWVDAVEAQLKRRV